MKMRVFKASDWLILWWEILKPIKSLREFQDSKRQRDREAWAPDLKFGGPEFKSRSDHQLNLFQIFPALFHWPWKPQRGAVNERQVFLYI